MDDPKTLISNLLNKYYIRHTGMMDNWFLIRKIQVTNFTDQDEVIVPPMVYDEIITAFMGIMKLPDEDRNDTINNLHKIGVFYMDSKNYIVFKRNS